MDAYVNIAEPRLAEQIRAVLNLREIFFEGSFEDVER